MMIPKAIMPLFESDEIKALATELSALINEAMMTAKRNAKARGATGRRVTRRG